MGWMDPFSTLSYSQTSDINGMIGAGELFSAEAFVKDNNIGGAGYEPFNDLGGYG
jgi:hypothetical protein